MAVLRPLTAGGQATGTFVADTVAMALAQVLVAALGQRDSFERENQPAGHRRSPADDTPADPLRN